MPKPEFKIGIYGDFLNKQSLENVEKYLEQGKAVGLKLDCYFLEYFTSKFHFAGHYVAIYGYDDHYAYLVDTQQQGGKVKTSLQSLEKARNAKGPMSSSNKSYIIERNNLLTNLKKAVQIAIHNNSTDFLNPPIKNIGYKGILKTSTEIKKWFKSSSNDKRDFQTTASLMERAGTGGALFRNLYRDFLKESAELLESQHIEEAYKKYAAIADHWREVSALFFQAGESGNFKYIEQASKLLLDIPESERAAMEKLGLL